jgi:hypothetical protein
MAQAVSRRSLNVEAQVRAWVSPSGICGGHNGNGKGFLRLLRFSIVHIIPLRLSILIYKLDEQKARLWPQFRDVHEQQQPFYGY